MQKQHRSSTEAHKFEKKSVILQSIGIIVIKSKKTRVVTYPANILVGI